MRKLPQTFFLALLATVFSTGRASADVIYSFTVDLNFEQAYQSYDAGTASGTFTYSDDLQTLLSVSISTSFQTISRYITFLDALYRVPSVKDASPPVTYSTYSFNLAGYAGSLFVRFSPMTTGTGSISITEGQFYYRSGIGVVTATSTAPVPEPSSLVTAALGVLPAAAAVLRGRRTRRARSSGLS